MRCPGKVALSSPNFSNCTAPILRALNKRKKKKKAVGHTSGISTPQLSPHDFFFLLIAQVQTWFSSMMNREQCPVCVGVCAVKQARFK